MILEKPYFMENEEWYYFDKKEFCFLTGVDITKTVFL